MSTETQEQPGVLTTPSLIAYHGDIAVKEKYLTRVRAHAAADQLVQNYGYWKDGKGCAVGCTLHSSDHASYETELGIPKALAHLEDRIFEGLPVEEARTWPERFLAAPRPGADLTAVPWLFIQWVLTSEIPTTQNEEVEALRASLLRLFEPLAQGGLLDRAAARALYDQAVPIRQRAWSARSKAWDDFYAARRRRRTAEAAAAEAAAEAAAAEAAAVAAVAAEAAAEAAVAAAEAAEAYWPARRAAFVRQSEKLLELMSAA